MKPYLFQLPDWLLGGRPLFSYGVMLGVSFIVGWSLCVYLCRRDGMEAKTASTTMFVLVIASLIGARLLHFATSPGAELTFANFIRFDEGGLVAYGGILGAILASYIYMRLQKADGWVFLDNAAPGCALGLGITRIGCFLFGCDYGVTETTSRWALRFPRWDDLDVSMWIPRSSPAYVDHSGAAFDSVMIMSDPVFPTQLYESLLGFLCFAILIVWHPAKRFHGQIALGFLGTYAIGRFLLELARGDADRGDDIGGLGLSTSQLIGIGLLVATAVLYVFQRRKGLYDAPGTSLWKTQTATLKGLGSGP